MRACLYAIIIMICSLYAGTANAQDYTSGPYYDRMVHSLIFDNPKNFNFTGFRMLYIGTTQYDPVGEKTRNKMMELAYTIQTDEDVAKQAAALDDYKLLVRKHLANMGAVALALSLAKQDLRFGDPEFYAKIRDGIAVNVLGSGDGKTLDGSYDVATLAEETFLMQNLNVKVIKSEAVNSGAVFYTMYDVIDRKTGDPGTIFVNTTFPMQHLEREARNANEKLAIPRQ